LRTFATIATDANRQLAAIQDSMPVIIDSVDWPLWLGQSDGDPGTLLRPAPEDVLRLWPVDKKVGNVRNDGPDLIKPARLVGPTLL
jgi:putative SOS response-associated peptidase YedK